MPEKVETLQRLMELAQQRRAVYCPSRNWQRKPAAFVIGMPGRTIAGFIEAGLYVYEKQEKVNEQ
jgi:hypothetical protein